MSQLLYGSLNLSKLMAAAKVGHKAFSRAENGQVYFNVRLWINDEKDKHGNDASLQLTFKDATKEDRQYFGNLKISEPTSTSVNPEDLPETDDLPF